MSPVDVPLHAPAREARPSLLTTPIRNECE